MADITNFFGMTNTYFDRYGVHSPRCTTVELTAPAVGKRFVSFATGETRFTHSAVSQTGDGAQACGVLDGDGLKGERRRVVAEGSAAEVEAGAAVKAGDAVQSDAQGRAIPLASGVQLGVARKDAAPGEYTEIQFSL